MKTKSFLVALRDGNIISVVAHGSRTITQVRHLLEVSKHPGYEVVGREPIFCCPQHHVVLSPKAALTLFAQLSESNKTLGGYNV